MGWGEFDIKIKIELIDESVKPIELTHALKFYNQPHQSQSSKKPVVSENYDEIIFVNPKPEILEQLLKDDNINSEVIFQEPINNKKNIDDGENDGNKDNMNNIGSSMEVEDEDKSLATNSQVNQNLSLTNNMSIISNDKTPMISNISQYFTKFDDTAIIKELNEKNEFVIQEIEKLKQELKKKEDDINNLNKEIRKYK